MHCISPSSEIINLVNMASYYKIMSEKALENLVCSNCNNYLSYGQPKTGTKTIICGRCDQEEGILQQFNDNICSYLFPCVNRFDGCKELLPYQEMEEHEKNCSQKASHSCTQCTYTGNGCQLYHHYIRKHPGHYLRHPFFNIHIKDAHKFNILYRMNNNLFMITYQIVQPDCVLVLLIRSIGLNREGSKCQIILKTPKKKQFYKTEFRDEIYEEIDISRYFEKHKENTMTCHLNIKVDAELFAVKTRTLRNAKTQDQLSDVTKALVRNLFPKLVCSTCKCYVVPPIFKCSSNHVRCEDCSSWFCSACADVVNWSRAADLEMFHAVLPLPCRWSCGANLLGLELRAHEKVCSERKYKCVEEWCSWAGSFKKLLRHWHSSAGVHRDTHKVFGFQEDLVEFYLMYDEELFYFRIDPLKVNGRNIHVRKVSDVSPPSQVYSARVLLTHKCDDVLREKSSYLKFGGITLLGKSFFDFFGECKNYKIVFSLSCMS